MCHLTMKLSDTYDQNPPCTFDRIRENHILMKKLSQLDANALGNKKHASQKNLSRGSLNNWCDANADAEISKTICRPPSYGGVGRWCWGQHN